VNTIATLDERVVALRRDYPLKYRVLSLIVEAMLREAEEAKQGGSK
jgi:hypothetical protein